MSHGDILYDVPVDEPCMEWDTYGDGGYDLCRHPEGTDMKGWIEMDRLDNSQSNTVRENAEDTKAPDLLDINNRLSYANRESLSCPNITMSTFDKSPLCEDKCSSAYTMKKVYSDSQLSSASSDYMSCATDDSTEDEEACYQKSRVPVWLENVDTIKGTRFDCPLISSVSNKNAQNFELKFPSTTVRLRIEVDPDDNVVVQNFGWKEEETTSKSQINDDVLPYEDNQLSVLPSELENTEELKSLLSTLDNSAVIAKNSYNIAFPDTCESYDTEEKDQCTIQVPWLHIYKSSENFQSNADNPSESEVDTTSSGETMLTEVTSSESNSLQIEFAEGVSRFRYKEAENVPKGFFTEKQECTEYAALSAHYVDSTEDVDENSSEDSLASDGLENDMSEQSALYDTDINDELYSAYSFSSQEYTSGNDIFTSFSFEELATGNAENDNYRSSNSSYSTEEFASDVDSDSVSDECPSNSLLNDKFQEQNTSISPIKTYPLLDDQQAIGEEIYIIRREDDQTYDGIQQTEEIADSDASLDGDREIDICASKYLENGDSDDDLVPERFFSSGSSLRSRVESLLSDMSPPQALDSKLLNHNDHEHPGITSITAAPESFEVVFDGNTDITDDKVRDSEISFKPERIIKGLAEIGHNAVKEEQFHQDAIEVDILESTFETISVVDYQNKGDPNTKIYNEFDVQVNPLGMDCDMVSYERPKQVTFRDTAKSEEPLTEKDEYLRVAHILVESVVDESQACILLEYWRSHNLSFGKGHGTLKNDYIEDFLSIPDSDETETTCHELDVNLSWSQFTQKSDDKPDVPSASSDAFESIQSFSVDVKGYSSQNSSTPSLTESSSNFSQDEFKSIQSFSVDVKGHSSLSSSSPSLAESSSNFSQESQNGGSNVSKNLKMKNCGQGRGKPYDPSLRDSGYQKRSREASSTVSQKHKRHVNTRNVILQELEQLANMLSKYAVLGARRDISHEYLEAEYARQREIRLLARYTACRLRPQCNGNGFQNEDWPTQRIEEPNSSRGVMKHVNFAADIQIINPYRENECDSVHVCQTCAMRNPLRKKKISIQAKKEKVDLEFPQERIVCSLCNRGHHRN